MNTLEKEFVLNADKRGDNKFVQVKRNEYAAIYQRFNMEGKPLEFEVFAIKVAGGTKIFGRYYDKYEAYPGASAFGRHAWSVGNLERAEHIFNEITRGKGSRLEGMEKMPKVAKVSRRKRNVRPELVLPKNKFSIKKLLALNSAWTQPALYVMVQKFIANKKIKVVGSEPSPSGRGKRMIIYNVVR